MSIEATAERLISTSFDGTCRVWDWAGSPLSCLAAHDGHASGLCLLESPERVLTGGDDGYLKQFDLATESCLTSSSGHNGGEGLPVGLAARPVVVSSCCRVCG